MYYLIPFCINGNTEIIIEKTYTIKHVASRRVSKRKKNIILRQFFKMPFVCI